eukprot:14505484-Alexandrium_andersonii.AAC.1
MLGGVVTHVCGNGTSSSMNRAVIGKAMRASAFTFACGAKHLSQRHHARRCVAREPAQHVQIDVVLRCGGPLALGLRNKKVARARVLT